MWSHRHGLHFAVAIADFNKTDWLLHTLHHCVWCGTSSWNVSILRYFYLFIVLITKNTSKTHQDWICVEWFFKCNLYTLLCRFYYMGKAVRLEKIFYRGENQQEQKYLTQVKYIQTFDIFNCTSYLYNIIHTFLKFGIFFYCIGVIMCIVREQTDIHTV